MKRGLIVVLFLLGVLIFSQNTKVQSQTEATSIYFARARFTDVPVYYDTSDQAIFIPSHDRIYRNSVQRLERIDDQWSRLYPDNGLYSPWYEYDGYWDVYVHNSDFDPITNFEPITVLNDTANTEKLVIVIRQYYPELYLVENNQIVAKIPTCLGGYYNNSTTPIGFFRIDASWVTRHMNTLPGVPFTVFYSQYLGTAFHGAPWRDWDLMDRGCYGSAGCINLPTPSKWDVFWNGERFGFDHFFFNWTRTNLFYDPYTQEPWILSWVDEGWYEGQTSIRVYVIEEINDLWNYQPDLTGTGRLDSWQPIIDQYYQLSEVWRLPDNTDGVVSFRDIPME